MFYDYFMQPLNGTKRCRDCQRFLSVEDFAYKYPQRAVYQSYCKIYQRRRSREHYLRNTSAYKVRVARNNQRTREGNRDRLRRYLSTQKCMDCGVRDLTILEFDHREPANKLRDVSEMVQKGFAWTTIVREIAKCDDVCANCHRRRTASQFDWHKVGRRELVLPTLPRRGSSDYERIKSRRSRLARRDRNRRLIWNYLSVHACVVCGEADPVVLEFDHVSSKAHDIDWLVPASGTARILVEIEKCRVLCTNCHRRHTAAQNGRLR
jgi:hypothetical protein